jgi:hypothetical protein
MTSNYKKYILSSGTHYISNSGSDENGGTKGGAAGDQTGKEFRLRSWYPRPWTCVLRWPDINVGTLLAELGIDAALNNKIGYDQWQRDTYWKQLKAVGYLPKNVAVACEEDCTAGVNANVHAAAYLLDIPALKAIPETGVRSSNMRKYYSAAGFAVLTDSKYLTSGDYLLPGDILLYDNHHAATNVTKGSKASYTYENVIDHLDNNRGSITITPEPTAEGLRRGDYGTAVTALQRLLKARGYDLGNYGSNRDGIDGDFGQKTEDAVKAFQQASGLPVTGVYDEATRAKLTGVEPAKRSVEITGGTVNVRSGPGTTGTRILGTAHKGDLLAWQGETYMVGDRPWYLVEYKGANGWVSSLYAKLV